MTVISHIPESMMRSFCSGALPAVETIVCAEHLESCADCRRLFDQTSPRTTNRRIPRDRIFTEYLVTGEHLGYEEISDYLDGSLSKDEIEDIESHLGFCSQCSEDLSSLKEFRAAGDSERDGQTIINDGIIRSWFRNISVPAPVFAVLALAIILAILAIITYRSKRQEPFSRQTPAISPTATPALAETGSTPKHIDIIHPPLHRVDEEKRVRRPGEVKTQTASDVIYDGKFKVILSDNREILGANLLSADIRTGVEDLLRGRIPENPVVADNLSQSPGGLRGSKNKDGIILLTPVGTVILEDKPVLKWSPVKEATGYVVNIVDESFTPVIESGELQTTEWAVTESLKRGVVYLWQVTAYKDQSLIRGGPGQIGKFMIISDARLAELDRARRKYRTHLELATYYLIEGLIDEAEKEIDKLRLSNPDSKVVEEILRGIKELKK